MRYYIFHWKSIAPFELKVSSQADREFLNITV